MTETHHHSTGATAMRLYVGNLPADTSKRDLEQLFGKYGNMLDVSVKRTVSGAPFAFIEFEDERDAQEAIHGRDGYNYNGSRLRVEIPFASRGGGSGRPRGRGRGVGAPRRGEYRVIVTGLPPSGSWQDLKDHMRDVGECVYADVFRDGTGVVEFTRRDDCEYALEKFKESKFRSHEGEVSRISVRLADDRMSVSPRPPSRGYRDEPRGYRDEPRGYRDEPRGYRDEPRGYRDEPRGYRDEPRGYRDEPRGYRDEPRGYRDEPRGYRDEPRGYRDDYRGGGVAYRGADGPERPPRFHDETPRVDGYRSYEERGRHSYSPAVNGSGSRGRSRSRSRR